MVPKPYFTDKSIRLATLDCAATLPSGKTTLDRFSLARPVRGPMILFSANLDKPAMAVMEAAEQTTGVKLVCFY